MQVSTYYLSLFFILLISCSNTKKVSGDDDSNDRKLLKGARRVMKQLPASADPHDPKLLYGTWLIEKEVCCGRNPVVTYGGTKELTIKAKDNVYIIRENGRILEKGVYKIDLKSEFGPVITFDEQFPAMYQVVGKSLILNWGYMDLQEETYTKQP